MICNRIFSWQVRKVASVAQRVAVWFAVSGSVHFRIFSERSRIARPLAMIFHLFSANLCWMLCAYLAWLAQYLVRLESDACCSAHYERYFICDMHQSLDSFCQAGAVIIGRSVFSYVHCQRRFTTVLEWKLVCVATVVLVGVVAFLGSQVVLCPVVFVCL